MGKHLTDISQVSEEEAVIRKRETLDKIYRVYHN
jgi:hypothetical protein